MAQKKKHNALVIQFYACHKNASVGTIQWCILFQSEWNWLSADVGGLVV